MRKLLLVLLTGIALVTRVPAQTTMHTHNADVIDGSKTPELIPDVIAWRLWMLSVIAPDLDHPELAQHRQDVFLKKAGFDDTELDQARKVLAQFKQDYEAMKQAHNQQVQSGINPSLADFRVRRDSLAASARDSLLSVTTQGDEIKKYLTDEKAHMRIPVEEAQQ